MIAQVVCVGCGGAVGALLRFGVTELVTRATGKLFPWGTFLVNVVGCLLIGLLWAWIESRDQDPVQLRLFLVTGLLGSLTTFSSYSNETVELLQTGRLAWATLYALGSLTVGLLMVVVGRELYGALSG